MITPSPSNSQLDLPTSPDRPPVGRLMAGSLLIVALFFGGLGTWAAGDETGRKVYEEAVAAFTAQLGSDETKDDAQFGLDQLGVVKTKYVDA